MAEPGIAANSILEWLKFVGAMAGLVAFTWKLTEVYRSWLHISIVCEVDQRVDILHMKTVVENKGVVAKALDSAFIIIGPENEYPSEIVKHLMESGLLPNEKFDSMNSAADIIFRHISINHNAFQQYDDGAGRFLIPLPYYFWENIKVGVETLSFDCCMSLLKLPRQKIFSARFYIHGPRRLYRSTQAAFHTFSPGEVGQ